jgi:SOS response regulatory protein OraA/RecX
MQRQVLDYFLYLLNRQDYSTGQLVEKALKKDYAGVDIKTAIAELTAAGYINDDRMAVNLIARYKGIKGKTWIQQKLLYKKIPKETITRHLIDEEEMLQIPDSSFKEKIKKKYMVTSWQAIDQKVLQKMLHYISRQGFSNPWGIIKSWQQEEE